MRPDARALLTSDRTRKLVAFDAEKKGMEKDAARRNA